MGIKVIQGLVEVDSVDLLHNTDKVKVYLVNTQQQRPKVISWNSSTLTLLPSDADWITVRPKDFTVIRFPETEEFTSVYQEERYGVYFIQFDAESPSSVAWQES